MRRRPMNLQSAFRATCAASHYFISRVLEPISLTSYGTASKHSVDFTRTRMSTANFIVLMSSATMILFPLWLLYILNAVTGSVPDFAPAPDSFRPTNPVLIKRERCLAGEVTSRSASLLTLKPFPVTNIVSHVCHLSCDQNHRQIVDRSPSNTRRTSDVPASVRQRTNYRSIIDIGRYVRDNY